LLIARGNIKPDNNKHIYCPNCWEDPILMYSNEGREYYHCSTCGYDNSRAVILYPNLRYKILDSDGLLHYTVGAIIEWGGRYLLFHRRRFPFQYTIVAGHWDLDDRTPEDAIRREILEEVSIRVVPSEPIAFETIYDPCYKGADFHEWRLYLFHVSNSDVTLSDEGDTFGWFSDLELKTLDLTIATSGFLKKFGII
jgi:8-oxo-dGTP pyrophosphatase MutT (NUDIX family)